MSIAVWEGSREASISKFASQHFGRASGRQEGRMETVVAVRWIALARQRSQRR